MPLLTSYEEKVEGKRGQGIRVGPGREPAPAGRKQELQERHQSGGKPGRHEVQDNQSGGSMAVGQTSHQVTPMGGDNGSPVSPAVANYTPPRPSGR